MSILSEQERDGLEDVFLSISSTRSSSLKWSLSQCHSYCVFYFKERARSSIYDYSCFEKIKNTLKWIIFQKNLQKVDKSRKI